MVYPLGATESASLAALAAAPSIRCTCEVRHVHIQPLAVAPVSFHSINARHQIPAGVIIPPEPRVSWWDPFRKTWSDEFISDVDVLPEKRWG
jgi:hypothetical protein